MSVKEYNPYQLEKPVLNLGPHGEFTLGDITEQRHAAAQAALGNLEAAADDDHTTIVAAVCALTEAVCENAEGVGEKLRTDFAEGRIGLKALIGVMQFVTEWLNDEGSAGEG